MKNILIIGATSAIAQEVAKIYAAQKHNFILWGRNQEMLQIISQDLKVRGAFGVELIIHDLNDLNDHASQVDTIWSQHKKIDVVLIAHGVLGDPRKAEVNQQEFLHLIQSNFISHASLLTFIGPKMRQQKEGALVVLSSVAGERGKQSNYVYGSAKAATTIFTDGLRNRLNGSGVQVITVKLGPVDTPMTKDHKKSPLFGNAPAVAQGIVRAVEKKKDIVYLPFFWRYIMWIIRAIPESIFKRLSL
jgi:decaprenylphospho-beta-D-erythro-pentofuranosid-2-ulose 2-reductase